MFRQTLPRALLLFAILSALMACAKPGTPIASPFTAGTKILLFTESETGKLLSTSAPLQPAQRKMLESAIFTRKVAVGEEFAACFIPHHFFRYYDNAGKQIGEIAVCFCCNGVTISPSGANPVYPGHLLDANYGQLGTLVEDLGARKDVECSD